MGNFSIISSGISCLYCKCNENTETPIMRRAAVNLGQNEAERCCRKVKWWLISCECSSVQSFSWIISLFPFHLKAGVPVVCCLRPAPVLLKIWTSSPRMANSLEVLFQVLELYCFWCHWNDTSSREEGDMYGRYSMVTKVICSEEIKGVSVGVGDASWELLHLPAVCAVPTTTILWNYLGRSWPEG